MPAKRTCPVSGCPKLIDPGQKRCVEHMREYERERNLRRRGQYDRQHKEASRKARAEAARERRPCPMCGQPMTDPAQMHYDHGVPLAVDPTARATRVVCASCNSSAGGRLAHGLPPKPRPQ